MHFYLVRHGEARSAAEDPQRSLSDQGRKHAEEVARAAAAKGICIFEILHSDKLRAKQTAEIMSRFLSPQDGIREISGLSPDDDPLVARAELETAKGSLMLVGHLPHLSRLASLLVAGDQEREIVNFPTAAIVCVAYAEGSWQLQWILRPKEI